jgi:hypothetical protein
MYPCGCVELDAKGSGTIDVDCGDPRCYRRTRPTNLVNVGRSQRRAIERRKR